MPTRSMIRAVAFAAAASLAAVSLGAQVPDAATLQRLRQQAATMSPEQLRARLNASGMTPQQVREQLKSAGMDTTALDSYLGRGPLPSGAPSAEAVRAVDLLTSAARAEMAAWRADSLRRDSLDPDVPTMIDTIPVFGLDVFRRRTTQFDPVTAGPVDGGYKLGAGDVLVVVLTGELEATYSLEVTRDGFVVVPQAGQVFVANLTLDQATRALVQRLGRTYSGVGTGAAARVRLFATVARLRTNQVFVLGDVARPGSYQVAAAGTMLTALYAAGGPTINGSLRAIELRRGGKVVAMLDAYDYLVLGDASRDVRLEQGDVLFVPRHVKRVLVEGKVGRPGYYEASATDVLADVVRAAGDFTADASPDRVLVQRILPPARRQPGVLERVAFDVTQAQLAAFGLEDGDKVRVFPAATQVRRQIAVGGHVWRPGPQGLGDGKSLGAALIAAGGVKPGFHAADVTILRLRPDSTRVQLTAALDAETGRPLQDLALAEDDSVHVWARSDFRPKVVRITQRLEGDSLVADTTITEQRVVTVGGAVRTEGEVPWARGLTLRQAILRAGGLDEGALLTEVEVARMPRDRTQGERAQTFRVPIDSGYLFERAPDGTYDGPPGLAGRAGRAPEFELEPYDVVNVLRQPEFAYLGSVTLTGEVRFPGRYAIRRRGERLRDLIERAGGLTQDAYADGAVFRRRVSKSDLAERQRLLASVRLAAVAKGAGGSPEGGAATSNPAMLTRYQEAVGEFLQVSLDSLDRVNVDLPRVLRDANARENFELRPDDELTIPRFSPTVTVKGFVNAPTTVAHVPGARLSWYVARAGGATMSDERLRAFVLQPNGAVESYHARWWIIPDGDPVPRPGAVVVVPPRDLSERRTNWGVVLGPIAQIVASVVALAVVVGR